MPAMVTAKPIHTTNVMAVPLFSGGAVCATSVENCGESAEIVTAQISVKMINSMSPAGINSQDKQQQMPEASKA